MVQGGYVGQPVRRTTLLSEKESKFSESDTGDLGGGGHISWVGTTRMEIGVTGMKCAKISCTLRTHIRRTRRRRSGGWR